MIEQRAAFWRQLVGLTLKSGALTLAAAQRVHRAGVVAPARVRCRPVGFRHASHLFRFKWASCLALRAARTSRPALGGPPAETNLSASVSVVPLPFLKDPTAVHVAADEHDTPRRLASVPTGFGVASNDQLAPSQCSPSVSCWPRMSWKKPTARQLLDEVHDTPFRTFRVELGLVVFSRNHWLPFHRRPRVK